MQEINNLTYDKLSKKLSEIEEKIKNGKEISLNEGLLRYFVNAFNHNLTSNVKIGELPSSIELIN